MTAEFPTIELRNISKNFTLESGNEIRVLKDVNLGVTADNVIAMLGPSGSGKSTCLRIMSGLLQPTEGQVLVNNEPLAGVNLNVAMVFQSFALFPWETVNNNIAMALKPLDLPPNEVKARVKKAIDLVGLEGFEEAYPRELSGGMKQRVGIARAIVMERPILFLDEPFTSLDVLSADTLRGEIINIWQSKNTAVRTMVLVTHNIYEAVYIAKKILIMGVKPGHIKTEIYNDLPYPRDEQAPGFRRMVARIHELIAEAYIPDAPAPTAYPSPVTKTIREPPIETIPNIQISEMIGLLESIADQGGVADIFDLAHKIGKDFGSTLYLVKAGELLDLLDTPRQTVILTDLGKSFLEGDINVRKRVLHELFGNLRIVQLATNLLKTEENYRIPLDTLRDRVAEWLPNENPEQICEAMISWGRFAEYFGYNDDTKEIYLDVGQEAT